MKMYEETAICHAGKSCGGFWDQPLPGKSWGGFRIQGLGKNWGRRILNRVAGTAVRRMVPLHWWPSSCTWPHQRMVGSLNLNRVASEGFQHSGVAFFGGSRIVRILLFCGTHRDAFLRLLPSHCLGLDASIVLQRVAGRVTEVHLPCHAGMRIVMDLL